KYGLPNISASLLKGSRADRKISLIRVIFPWFSRIEEGK
ncbi:uncharacterized protein METZ01_LOCUS139295, partial [marine metagenome]